MTAKLYLCIAAAALVGGCTSYRGPDRLDTRSASTSAARVLGFRAAFTDDLSDALAARKTKVSAAERKLSSDRVLVSGFALIRSNCRVYFQEMGRNQRNSQVLRDLITPITTVFNGLVGLKAFSNAENVNGDIGTGFALVSGASASALDIYDNRFLFGSDNIASVEGMILKALSSHQASVESNPPTDVLFAINQLQANEDICTPPQILSLVRESIKAAQPVTTGGPAPTPPPVAPVVQPGANTERTVSIR